MWMILVCCLCLGRFMYNIVSLLFGKTFRNIIKEQKKASSYYFQYQSIIDEIRNDNPTILSQLAFLHKKIPFIEIQISNIMHLENGFDVMLEELKKAKNYIFMEYFII